MVVRAAKYSHLFFILYLSILHARDDQVNVFGAPNTVTWEALGSQPASSRPAIELSSQPAGQPARLPNCRPASHPVHQTASLLNNKAISHPARQPRYCDHVYTRYLPRDQERTNHASGNHSIVSGQPCRNQLHSITGPTHKALAPLHIKEVSRIWGVLVGRQTTSRLDHTSCHLMGDPMESSA